MQSNQVRSRASIYFLWSFNGNVLWCLGAKGLCRSRCGVNVMNRYSWLLGQVTSEHRWVFLVALLISLLLCICTDLVAESYSIKTIGLRLKSIDSDHLPVGLRCNVKTEKVFIMGIVDIDIHMNIPPEHNFMLCRSPTTANNKASLSLTLLDWKLYWVQAHVHGKVQVRRGVVQELPDRLTPRHTSSHYDDALRWWQWALFIGGMLPRQLTDWDKKQSLFTDRTFSLPKETESNHWLHTERSHDN